jgi:hypothetical protein
MPTPTDALTGEWQFVATLDVPGVSNLIDNWDSIEGGDTTSDTRTYRSGGDVEPEAMPAAPATSDITLERAYRGARDGSLRNDLAAKIGYPAKITVFSMRTDRTAEPGTSETITGIIKEVTRPVFRSEGDGVALYRVVVTPNGHWSKS